MPLLDDLRQYRAHKQKKTPPFFIGIIAIAAGILGAVCAYCVASLIYDHATLSKGQYVAGLLTGAATWHYLTYGNLRRMFTRASEEEVRDRRTYVVAILGGIVLLLIIAILWSKF